MSRSFPKYWRWGALVLLAVALVVAARVLPVKEWVGDFNVWVQRLGPKGMVLYGLVYVVVAVLLGPAWLLTIGAGFAFGLLWGTLVVSLASTTAAAIAFLIARHLARDRVERLARKNEKFEAIDRAIAQKGWKVVALLRLSPLVPYTISNYLYGLTGIRFLPYVLASWLGMIPLTVLYVYFGTLGRVAVAAAGEARERSPWEWAALGVGLLATVAGAVVLTRMARRELEKLRLEKAGRPAS